MKSLRAVEPNEQIEFFGYGGKYMAAEGFENSFEVNMDDMLDKTFHTFRKSKTNYIGNHWKWTPFNLVNKHYTRSSD